MRKCAWPIVEVYTDATWNVTRACGVYTFRCRWALRLYDPLFTYIESLPTYNYRLPILLDPLYQRLEPAASF